MKDTTDLKKQIFELQKSLIEAKQYNEKLAAGDLNAVAEALHTLLCRSNHTDGCDWEYGSTAHSQKEYRLKAARFLTVVKELNISIKDALDFLKEFHKS